MSSIHSPICLLSSSSASPLSSPAPSGSHKGRLGGKLSSSSSAVQLQLRVKEEEGEEVDQLLEDQNEHGREGEGAEQEEEEEREREGRKVAGEEKRMEGRDENGEEGEEGKREEEIVVIVPPALQVGEKRKERDHRGDENGNDENPRHEQEDEQKRRRVEDDGDEVEGRRREEEVERAHHHRHHSATPPPSSGHQEDVHGLEGTKTMLWSGDLRDQMDLLNMREKIVNPIKDFEDENQGFMKEIVEEFHDVLLEVQVWSSHRIRSLRTEYQASISASLQEIQTEETRQEQNRIRLFNFMAQIQRAIQGLQGMPVLSSC